MRWLLLFALAGCGPDEWTTPAGIRVIQIGERSYSGGDIDAVAFDLEERLGKRLELDRMTLRLYDRKLDCDYGKCAGLAFGPHDASVVTVNDCIAFSAWPHELTHMALWAIHDDPDYNHAGPWFGQSLVDRHIALSRSICGYDGGNP